MKRNILALFILASISLSACETSVDSRVSDDEPAQVRDRHDSRNTLDGQISSDFRKKPRPGFAAESTLIVLVN